MIKNKEAQANHWFTVLFLVIPLTWAGSFIAGKYALFELTAYETVFLRFLFSGLIMLFPLLLFRRKSHPKFSDKSFLLHLVIVIIFSGIGYHYFFFKGLKLASPTNTALIIALNPFFTAFGEIFFLKTTRESRFYVGFALAFLGALLVNITRTGSGFNMPGPGELYNLIASLMWSVYTILSKKTKTANWDPYWIGFYNYGFTALLLLPVMGITSWSGIWHNLSVTGWTAVLYMAIFPTAIGYTLFYIGIQKKGPGWAATFIYIVPSFTAILEMLFFGTELTIMLISGTVMVVGGLLFGNTQLFKKDRNKKKPQHRLWPSR